MRKITIQDVAKKLNLSRNTVAKALSNSETVAYETRCVVIKKAYEMGYNKLSSAIINEYKINDSAEKMKTVVVFARRELSTFWNRIIMGISEELNKNNCRLQLNFISEEDEVNHVLPLDMQTDMSGIIILSVFQRSFLESTLKKDVPVVFLDAPSNVYDISDLGDVVLFESFNSTRIITEHVIQQGMTKIGFLGDISYCRTISDRYKGYLKALKMNNILPNEELIITKHVPNRYYNREEVAAAMEKLPYLPQALVCANDDIARDAILWLRSKGIAVPKDIVITGFDDKEEAAILSPSLTTVHIGNQRVGRRLVQRLMWRIENTDLPKEIVIVNTEPIFRESSEKIEK